MTTYKIICTTNAYQAARNSMFKSGKTEATICGGLALKQAQKKLLDLYNEIYEEERMYARNWGLAVIQSIPRVCGASATFSDGTRAFDYDGYRYSIEEENEE